MRLAEAKQRKDPKKKRQRSLGIGYSMFRDQLRFVPGENYGLRCLLSFVCQESAPVFGRLCRRWKRG